ncbi:hypothetical protein F4810DRAFT_685805 [Camillea tinctor]|nr:hypothetical protein F4810DRAFT_685805 [Camillea tinctor]
MLSMYLCVCECIPGLLVCLLLLLSSLLYCSHSCGSPTDWTVVSISVHCVPGMSCFALLYDMHVSYACVCVTCVEV